MPKQIDYKYEVPSDNSFFSLKPGKNRLRLVTEPSEVIQHETKTDGKWGTTDCKGTGCELCTKGLKLRYRFAYIAIDRKDEKLYVLEIGKSIFRQIIAYATDEEYGDPKQYDLTIDKEGEKLNTQYKVIASPKKSPLTEEELKLIKETELTIDSAYEK